MLSDKVELGENMGLSVEKLANTTELDSNFSAENKEPDNRELKMLKELLKSGSKDEQHLLAQALLEMVALDSDKLIY
ncbi:DUF3243 family protein [Sporosarcina sp. NPDC096371]|uniref:DUF3243 family protein n=1 Tax=Sporosarcina sp. NPDC096371 TaxID=3364530 RepID=UPI0038034E59